jgi:membrane-bound lytic murein transglycosylase D
MRTARSLLRPLFSALLFGAGMTACQPGLQPITAPVPARGDAVARRTPTAADRTTPEAVMRTAASVFGDSTSFDGIPDGTLSEEPTWDIDVRSYETHERVEHYLRLFSGPARERMTQRINRGTRYEPMIRGKLREAGMPEDLHYLALIESGFDPHAVSSASAVGMWQFMAATGRGVGLRIDWWVDERRDPARSTDAAIKFLGSLQRQFGSLFLAAAAYNGGPGRVARGLTRYAAAIGEVEGDDKFFALAEQNYLHSETKNYVPQLIAAAMVAKAPDRFGMEIERQAPYWYDSVLVEPGTSLGAVARAAAIPLDSLRELNPGLLRGVAPPDRAEWFRLPLGTDSLVRTAYDALPEEERIGWVSVEPTQGETLAALAKRHERTVRELGWYNPGLRTARSGAIVAGQTVRVPTREAIDGARVVNDAALSRTLGTATVHVVRSGESLGVIGRQYGVSVARLKALNALRTDRITVGQRLVVQGGGSAVTPASSRASSGGAATAASATTVSHTVRRGESLGVIAQRYGTSVAQLRSLNGLRSDRIQAGQKLVVRRG